jgi:hypothetical protein
MVGNRQNVFLQWKYCRAFIKKKLQWSISGARFLHGSGSSDPFPKITESDSTLSVRLLCFSHGSGSFDPFPKITEADSPLSVRLMCFCLGFVSGIGGRRGRDWTASRGREYYHLTAYMLLSGYWQYPPNEFSNLLSSIHYCRESVIIQLTINSHNLVIQHNKYIQNITYNGFRHNMYGALYCSCIL